MTSTQDPASLGYAISTATPSDRQGDVLLQAMLLQWLLLSVLLPAVLGLGWSVDSSGAVVMSYLITAVLLGLAVALPTILLVGALVGLPVAVLARRLAGRGASTVRQATAQSIAATVLAVAGATALASIPGSSPNAWWQSAGVVPVCAGVAWVVWFVVLRRAARRDQERSDSPASASTDSESTASGGSGRA